MPEADSVLGWIAQMRDYNNVPDIWLLDEEITAGEIIYIALAHGAYKGYENKIREKLNK
jgi:hypothetical protein|nr:MAG TPA: hypothetical protein [Caudoviricetes sp.]